MNINRKFRILFVWLLFLHSFHVLAQGEKLEEASSDIQVMQLYKDSDSYYKKIEMAKKATKRIWMSTMILDCSDSSMVFWNELARKKKEENVDVKIIGEGLYLGTIVSRCKNVLRDLDLEVTSVFDHIRKGGSITRMQHQKFIIIDDDEVILGGQNFIKYTNLSNDNNLYVRDTDVYIKSLRIAEEVQDEFVWMWNFFTKSDKLFMVKIKNSESLDHTKKSCRIVIQNPRRNLDQGDDFLRQHLATAQAAYFISPDVKWTPSSTTFNLLKKRVAEGLRFTLLRPGYAKTPDEGSMFFRDNANQMLKNGDYLGAGLTGLGDLLYKKLSSGSDAKTLHGLKKNLGEQINVYEYKKYTHTKAYIFDNQVAMLGSINFEVHSLDGNYEMGFVCDDPEFVKQMIDMFNEDRSHSKQVL